MKLLKIFIEVLVDGIIPVFSMGLFILTFLGEFFKDVESLWIKIPMGFLTLAVGFFYCARFRQIWIRGSQEKRENSKNKNY